MNFGRGMIWTETTFLIWWHHKRGGVEVLNIFNRDRIAVVKARVKVDVNLPLCIKVKLTLENGEIVKFSIFYLGFLSAKYRTCYVLNHS